MWQHASLGMSIIVTSGQRLNLSGGKISESPGSRPQPPHPHPLSHLEVRLLQDAHELVGCLAAVGDGAQLLQDVLHQLHIVLTHRLQLGLFKLLVSLVGQSTQSRPY